MTTMTTGNTGNTTTTMEITGATDVTKAVEALRSRMTRRFIDVDEAFAQLASELRWQTDQAAWGLRRARRMLQA